MAKDNLIRLSVYPHIRKYLLFHHSEKLFNGNDLGFIKFFILNCLQPMPKVDPATWQKPERIDHGATFDIALSDDGMRKYGNYVSSADVKRFNQAVADMIHDEMYRMVILLTEGGLNVDQAIRKFQSFYKFSEDDLPFENLKKWYYRERRRVQMRLVHNADPEPQQGLVLTYYEENEPIHYPAA